MHISANALSAVDPSLDSNGPSLGAKWIKLNILAALVFTVLNGVVGVLVDSTMIIGRSPTVTTLWIAGAIGFATLVAIFAIYAAFTGSVLGAKLPAFSRRAWIVLHGALGAALGVVVVASYLDPVPVRTESIVMPAGQIDVPFAAFVILVVGPAVGALLGGLQALVLRPAARGVRAWIAWSAIAGVAVTVFAATISILHGIRFQSGLAYQVVAHGSIFVGLMLIAIAMVPALNRLVPKN